MPPDERASDNDVLTRLGCGEVEIRGRLPWSSNYTFLVDVTFEGTCTPAVYKPLRGERPLWDFGSGLFRREVAAYEVSRALGWDLVPATIARGDAPHGMGSLQHFVEVDYDQHYFTLLERPERHADLVRICVFDVIINNADRKGGHCLLDGEGHVWAVDHGLCFHADPKLRTVIWDFGGQRVPDDLAADAARFAKNPPLALSDLLGEDEVDALIGRAEAIGRAPELPEPTSERAYPWPLV
jgi:uncharacterized repeat protein (TIGR03843 family)